MGRWQELHAVLESCYKKGQALKDYESRLVCQDDGVISPEHEGMMRKKGQVNKALKSRFFRLRHGVLYYYKDQKCGNATSADLNHIGSLACKEMKLQIEDVPMTYNGQTLYAFTVLAKGQDSSKWRVLECACQSERERTTWTDKISAAIEVAQTAAANTPSLENDPSTHSNNSGIGKRQSVILEAHGQPASNIYRCLQPLPQ